MSVRVLEWDFRNKGLEGYYARDFETSVLAVQDDLRPEAKRARELEARGYEERPLSFKWDQKYCYAAGSLLQVDSDAVRSLRPTIEEDEPGWVEAVKREWKGYWNIESTAYWSEVPIQAVVAILLNLSDRGELEVGQD